MPIQLGRNKHRSHKEGKEDRFQRCKEDSGTARQAKFFELIDYHEIYKKGMISTPMQCLYLKQVPIDIGGAPVPIMLKDFFS